MGLQLDPVEEGAVKKKRKIDFFSEILSVAFSFTNKSHLGFLVNFLKGPKVWITYSNFSYKTVFLLINY